MSVEEKKPKKDSICNVLIYTMFPTSTIGIKHEISKIDDDLEKLHTKLYDERATFEHDAVMIRKLNNKNIPMDSKGMTRTDAIKSLRSKMKITLSRIKHLEKQVAAFETARRHIETNQITKEFGRSMQQIKNHLTRVNLPNIDQSATDVDQIVEIGKEIEESNNNLDDIIVSAWNNDVDDPTDIDLDKALASIEEEGEFEGTSIKPYVVDKDIEDELFSYKAPEPISMNDDRVNDQSEPKRKPVILF